MIEHPLIMRGDMVRATIARMKRQTRRVAKLNAAGRVARGNRNWHPDDPDALLACPYGQPGDQLWVRETVRAHELSDDEARSERFLAQFGEPMFGLDGVDYLADGAFIPIENSREASDRWADLGAYRMKGSGPLPLNVVPSIHMPRWASRIQLEIERIRLERLRDITEADAIDEGILEQTVIVGADCAGGTHREINGIRYFWDGGDDEGYEYAVDAFAALFASINGPALWDIINLLVWVVEFKILEVKDGRR